MWSWRLLNASFKTSKRTCLQAGKYQGASARKQCICIFAQLLSNARTLLRFQHFKLSCWCTVYYDILKTAYILQIQCKHCQIEYHSEYCSKSSPALPLRSGRTTHLCLMPNPTGGLHFRQQTPHLSFIFIPTALKQAATSHKNMICISLQTDLGKTQVSPCFLSFLLKTFALQCFQQQQKKGHFSQTLMLMAI